MTVAANLEDSLNTGLWELDCESLRCTPGMWSYLERLQVCEYTQMPRD